MRSPAFLVTNDDGIESPFLAALVRALLPVGSVTVVAPSGERSWIGKAISRRGQVGVRSRSGLFECHAWEVDGTPADCVNLGLGHLIATRVDAVVSGINIGSNAGLPLILASGTVGGALEGALLGRHAIATSMRLDPVDFAAISRRSGEELPAHLQSALLAAADRTTRLCVSIARKRVPRRFLVHNLNFPPRFSDESVLQRTVPAWMSAGNLFSPVEDTNGQVYAFSFAIGSERTAARLSDRECIESGQASHSILDFGRIGVPAGVPATSAAMELRK
ncbi:MAG TPA: 5'/3'-nucleotidase SurE [Opitutaceae bacterium]